MKNYQLMIKTTRNMLKEWLEAINAPLAIFAYLNSASKHDQYNKISNYIIEKIEDIEQKQKIASKFKKIQLI